MNDEGFGKGNREQGTGNREKGKGKREKGKGKRGVDGWTLKHLKKI
jgi:hypothetical protein